MPDQVVTEPFGTQRRFPLPGTRPTAPAATSGDSGRAERDRSPAGVAARVATGDPEWEVTGPADAVRRPRATRSRARRVWRWFVPAFLSMLLLPPLLGVALVATIYRQARTDEARPVQAIVVLGAAQYNGRPTSVLRARLDHAHDLWERGLAPVIVLTGGQQPGDVTTEAEAGRDYLIGLGVPESALLLETQGRDTWESMVGVDAVLEPLGITRVLLVSDGFHLLRSERMARDLGFEAYSSAAPDSPIRPNTGREFGFVVREAVALAAHVIGRLA